MFRAMIVGAVALGAAASAAIAGPVYSFSVSANAQGQLPYGGNSNAAGKFNTVSASFDTNTNEFTLDVLFDDRKTDGLWVAINGGPNPKGHAGEMAILYFGKKAGSNQLVVSAYAYNGVNGDTSYKDGNGDGSSGDADFITNSIVDNSFLLSAGINDVSGGGRRVSFTIDAGIIQNHSPANPGNTPWTGVAFGETAGIWLHTVSGSSFQFGTYGTYDDKLKKFTYYKQGWYDANFIPTDHPNVPMPAAAGLGLAGMLTLGSQRRRRTA
ncbi:MAG: hypothetical protein H6815_10730 [Phycisphaeraceae bacterium]|nr:VPLPA-CTERM sorting domain-containing protein [Phycisphaerales bacterium]MCB9860910.1 hypothetical protein [Phycisphaeraceae bacterium]